MSFVKILLVSHFNKENEMFKSQQCLCKFSVNIKEYRDGVMEDYVFFFNIVWNNVVGTGFHKGRRVCCQT